MSERIDLKALPPAEAVDYFRKKGYRLSFDWRDMWQEDHAQAFTVAKVMRTDILQDIRQAVDEAIAGGTTLSDFKKRLKPVLQEKGWWGRKTMTDPLTGEEREVQLGSSRRLRTIFDTNMRTAYAAGKWERVQRTKKTRPYLRYVAVLDERTRQQHRIWHDTVLPADHPFWNDHYPPNGWHCRCSVQQLGPRDLERLGLKVNDRSPKAPDRVWIDKRNGRAVKVPQGIDPGFAYNPGKARMKALTPPPLDKPLDVPFTGSPAAVPMPGARSAASKDLYPDGLEDEEYVRRFLTEFGAAPGQPTVFRDAAGEPVIISDDLFKTVTGRLKIGKDMRFRYLGLLAETIKNPDEIWWVWEEYPKDRWTLRRKYLARWSVDGRAVPGFVLFDTGKDGWTGVTAFSPRKEAYIDRQRKGALVYRKPDKK